MNKGVHIAAALALLSGTAYASQYDGRIAADGLRINKGASSARVSVAVSMTTACGSRWYAYENADSGLGMLWTEALIQARIHDRTIKIVGTGNCDLFGIEVISFIDLK